MKAATTAQLIETKLTLHLRPSHLEIIDESDRHAGHAGARSGGGHFKVIVVSQAFDGLSAPQRHRLVYGILAAEMNGVIHALSLSTLAPSEWSAPITGPS